MPLLFAAQRAQVCRNSGDLLVGQLAFPCRHNSSLPAIGDRVNHVRVGEPGLRLGAGEIGLPTADLSLPSPP